MFLPSAGVWSTVVGRTRTMSEQKPHEILGYYQPPVPSSSSSSSSSPTSSLPPAGSLRVGPQYPVYLSTILSSDQVKLAQQALAQGITPTPPPTITSTPALSSNASTVSLANQLAVSSALANGMQPVLLSF